MQKELEVSLPEFETLTIDGFVKFAKAMGFKYIVAATVYDEDGNQMKTSLDKSKSEKWKALSQQWKKKK
jgi:hypothetical protein